jgi:hypothetical protein
METKNILNTVLLAVIASALTVIAYMTFVQKTPLIPSDGNPIQTVPVVRTPESKIPEIKNETPDWKKYTNTQYGFEIEYPADARLDISTNPGCVQINTREFGFVSIDLGSSEPCGTPTGIGIGMVKVSDAVSVADKQYAASGYRDADNSSSFLSFEFPPDGKIRTVVYGVDHFDKSNPKNWKNLGSFTSDQYESALQSGRKILSTFKFTNYTSDPATANWKTYSNKTIGIEFRYPSSWSTLPSDNSGDVIKDGKTYNSFMLSLVDLSILQHTFLDYDNLPIERQYEKIICQKNNELVVAGTCENRVSSNGVKYTWQIEKTLGGLDNEALVATGKYILVFNFRGKDNYDKREDEYQKLLSTLKIAN